MCGRIHHGKESPYVGSAELHKPNIWTSRAVRSDHLNILLRSLPKPSTQRLHVVPMSRSQRHYEEARPLLLLRKMCINVQLERRRSGFVIEVWCCSEGCGTMERISNAVYKTTGASGRSRCLLRFNAADHTCDRWQPARHGRDTVAAAIPSKLRKTRWGAPRSSSTRTTFRRECQWEMRGSWPSAAELGVWGPSYKGPCEHIKNDSARH